MFVYFDWVCSTFTITCVHTLFACDHSVPRPALHVLISKSLFLCSFGSPMIIHVRLTLKQPLINCGSLGHTLGQITQL